jgi:hypothetical protein
MSKRASKQAYDSFNRMYARFESGEINLKEQTVNGSPAQKYDGNMKDIAKDLSEGKDLEQLFIHAYDRADISIFSQLVTGVLHNGVNFMFDSAKAKFRKKYVQLFDLIIEKHL